MSTSRAQADQPAARASKSALHTAPAVHAPLAGVGAYKRWDLQHEIHKKMLGGLYVPREHVEAALAPKDGHTPRILDVGTGSGIWALDMANKFPNCEVIGIDIVLPAPIQSQANLRFEVADVNLPLPMETSSVDYVFARMMDNPILDYPKWLSEVSRILRPGGVYEVFSTTMRTIQEDGTELPTVPIGEEGYTGFQNVLSAFRQLPFGRWGNNVPYERWTSWMEENGNFEKVERRKNVLVPVGAWQKGIDENTKVASELMQENLLILMSDYKPLLIGAHGETLVNRWTEDATVELTEPRFHVLTEWASAWCIRSANEWKPLESGNVA